MISEFSSFNLFIAIFYILQIELLIVGMFFLIGVIKNPK
jgi:hypothetical protein